MIVLISYSICVFFNVNLLTFDDDAKVAEDNTAKTLAQIRKTTWTKGIS